MRFVLAVKLGNAAMQSPADLHYAIQHSRLYAFDGKDAEPFTTDDRGTLRDVNGNTVGHWYVESEET